MYPSNILPLPIDLHLSHHVMMLITGFSLKGQQKDTTKSSFTINKNRQNRKMQLLYPKKCLSRKSGNLWVDNLEKAITCRVRSSITLHFYKLENEDQAAQLLLQEITYYLERRVPFRRLKAVLLQELGSNYTEGVRVVCSGRVGGRSKKAQRARKEGFQLGQTSSHVFSSRLSFASGSGLTPFGKIGIKVWICYKQLPLL